MKLLNEELEILLTIVREFSDLSIRLDSESEKMEAILEEKKNIEENLIAIESEIKSVREKEKEFTDSLIEKYGPFKFDLENFEIELLKKEEI
jgi:hypothetical protein